MMASKNPPKAIPNSRQYWKHLGWVLVVKCVLFSAMWYAFFREAPMLNDKTTADHVFLKH
jgi:hypothetical protein